MKGHILVSILFFLFAIVQWNDPDPYLWILLYFAVALIPLFYIKENINVFILGAGLFLLILVTATYLPALSNWISAGLPSITNSMNAESPHIELIREFFGLILCILSVSYYYFKSKRLEAQ